MAATLRRHNLMAEKLPLDIVAIEILPRLPTKSLSRFKSVCKFFKTLISSSDFNHLHLRHSLSSETNRLLILVGEDRRRLFSLNLDSPFSTAAVNLPLPRSLDSLNPSFSVIGSCNGLVCIRVSFPDEFRVSLKNPSTGVYRQLLFSKKGSSTSPRNFGFGFDSEADDYKLVAIINHTDPYGLDYGIREVMIYSLKTGNWRSVEKTLNPSDGITKSESGTLINNHLLHWKLWSLSSNVRVSCLDLQTEQWGNDVPLPIPIHFDQWRNEQSDLIDLGVLSGFLCLSAKTQGFGFPSFSVDLWIMKEYGYRESWMKLLRNSYPSPSFPVVFKPIAHCSRGSRGDGVWIWQGCYEDDDEDDDMISKLISYNVEDETVKMAEIQGLSPFSKVYICSESLVAVPGGKTILELEQMESNLDQEVTSSLRELTEIEV